MGRYALVIILMLVSGVLLARGSSDELECIDAESFPPVSYAEIEKKVAESLGVDSPVVVCMVQTIGNSRIVVEMQINEILNYGDPEGWAMPIALLFVESKKLGKWRLQRDAPVTILPLPKGEFGTATALVAHVADYALRELPSSLQYRVLRPPP